MTISTQQYACRLIINCCRTYLLMFHHPWPPHVIQRAHSCMNISDIQSAQYWLTTKQSCDFNFFFLALQEIRQLCHGSNKGALEFSNFFQIARYAKIGWTYIHHALNQTMKCGTNHHQRWYHHAGVMGSINPCRFLEKVPLFLTKAALVTCNKFWECRFRQTFTP